MPADLYKRDLEGIPSLLGNVGRRGGGGSPLGTWKGFYFNTMAKEHYYFWRPLGLRVMLKLIFQFYVAI